MRSGRWRSPESAPLPVLPAREAAVPPPALPQEPFALTRAWLVTGTALLVREAPLLVRVAPLLVRGLTLAPAVLATTHAFTLGVVATGILGARWQMGPVAPGVGPRSFRVTRIGSSA